MKYLYVDCETTGLDEWNDDLIVVGYALDHEKTRFWWVEDGPIPKELEELLTDKHITKVMHRANFDLLFTNRYAATVGPYFDTQIVWKMQFPSQSSALKDIGKEFFGVEVQKFKDLVGDGKRIKKLLKEISREEVEKYLDQDVSLTRRVHEQEQLLGVPDYYKEIEAPLVQIVLDAELRGLPIDEEKLNTLITRYEADITEAEKEFIRLGINPKSSKQVGKALEALTGDVKKTDKGNIITGKAALVEANIPFTKAVLKHRGLSKLYSTYLLPFKAGVIDGRMHGVLSQGGTVTGRFSSRNPNLQNIPAKKVEGKEIRGLFIPSPGKSLVVADYSQIELRLIAEFSKDALMVAAFNSGADLHSLSAQNLFNKKDITPAERHIGKTMNFAISYGSWGKTIRETLLKEEAELVPSVQECNEYIKRFYELYLDIQDWKKQEVAMARFHKGVTTIGGRFIGIQPPNVTNWKEKSKFERDVVSYLVQGSAADFIKKAILTVADRLPDLTLLNTVHDELIYEVDSDNAQDYADIIRDCMENVYPTKHVKIVSEVKVCQNWGEK